MARRASVSIHTAASACDDGPEWMPSCLSNEPSSAKIRHSLRSGHTHSPMSTT